MHVFSNSIFNEAKKVVLNNGWFVSTNWARASLNINHDMAREHVKCVRNILPWYIDLCEIFRVQTVQEMTSLSVKFRFPEGKIIPFASIRLALKNILEKFVQHFKGFFFIMPCLRFFFWRLPSLFNVYFRKSTFLQKVQFGHAVSNGWTKNCWIWSINQGWHGIFIITDEKYRE